jgi:hypothetical protein
MLPSLLHNIVILGGVAPRMVDSGPARSCSESHKILSWACATFRMKQDYGDIISKLGQAGLGAFGNDSWQQDGDDSPRILPLFHG